MCTKSYRIFVLSIFTLWMTYAGFNQYQSVNEILNAQPLTTKQKSERSLEIGNKMVLLGGILLFTAIVLQRAVSLQNEQDLTI